jgi:hypothetical protein
VTFRRVSSVTSGDSLITLETVTLATPDRRATSLIVGFLDLDPELVAIRAVVEYSGDAD